LLTVWDALGTWRVARLLNENLGEPDHLTIVVQLFGEINHLVSRVLLVAWPSSSQKGGECGNRKRVAFLSTSRSEASSFPLLSGIGDNLSNTLGVKGCSLCAGKSESEQEDRGKFEHRRGYKER
jgi:hypothetical protein